MTLGLAMAAETQHEVLEVLCERNQSGDLMCCPEDGPPVRGRVRFLALSGDTLVIDPPARSGRALCFPVGEMVRVSFLLDGQRMAFTSRVRGRSRRSCAGSSPIDALLVEVPAEIERARRQECYRLSMLHLPRVTACFRPLAETDEEPVPGFEATLMNLSETGCGVMVEKRAARQASVDDLYEVVFALPGMAEPCALVGVVRWKKDLQDGGRVMMGVGWQLDASRPGDREMQRRLAWYVVEEQRRMLRRLRSGEDVQCACE